MSIWNSYISGPWSIILNYDVYEYSGSLLNNVRNCRLNYCLMISLILIYVSSWFYSFYYYNLIYVFPKAPLTINVTFYGEVITVILSESAFNLFKLYLSTEHKFLNLALSIVNDDLYLCAMSYSSGTTRIPIRLIDNINPLSGSSYEIES